MSAMHGPNRLRKAARKRAAPRPAAPRIGRPRVKANYVGQTHYGWTVLRQYVRSVVAKGGKTEGIARNVTVLECACSHQPPCIREITPAWLVAGRRQGCSHTKGGQLDPRYKGVGELPGFLWTRIEQRAAAYGRQVTVSKEAAFQKFLDQERRCFLSGWPIEFGTSRAQGTASFDRPLEKDDYDDSTFWTHAVVNNSRKTVPIPRYVDLLDAVWHRSLDPTWVPATVPLETVGARAEFVDPAAHAGTPFREMPGRQFGYLLVLDVRLVGASYMALTKCLGGHCDGKPRWQCAGLIRAGSPSRGGRSSTRCKKCAGAARRGGGNANFTGYEEVRGRLISAAKARSRRKGWSDDQFEIDAEFIWELYNAQGQRCALSGLPIVFQTPRGRRCTVSIDRIDNDRPYTRDNVQLVHYDIQMIRGALSMELFRQLARDVATFSASKKNGLPIDPWQRCAALLPSRSKRIERRRKMS